MLDLFDYKQRLLDLRIIYEPGMLYLLICKRKLMTLRLYKPGLLDLLHYKEGLLDLFIIYAPRLPELLTYKPRLLN